MHLSRDIHLGAVKWYSIYLNSDLRLVFGLGSQHGTILGRGAEYAGTLSGSEMGSSC